MANPKPLLILSDAPSANSGLGRITRDLAMRISAHLTDTFRCATLGYGGTGSSNHQWQEYAIQSPVTTNGWFVPEIQDVWEDFAGTERGIVMTIWDPSRLGWFACPTQNNPLYGWLSSKPFERWGYFPVDASGPNGKLTASLGEVIKGYDRGLCYSQWAEGIVRETIGAAESERLGLTSLPHGIDCSVFQPHDRIEAKRRFAGLGFTGLTDSSFLVGIVATNQARKDFGLGIEVCSHLKKQGLDVRLWIHTDTLKRHWDLVALLTDFGLIGQAVITTYKFSDEEMCWMYSACNVTLGIGAGEGFGYPMFESLASGTPCIHGDYGGAAEHLSLIDTPFPKAWRLEGQFNCMRPIFDVEDWVSAAIKYGGMDWLLPPELDWQNLWPRWQSWLLAGVK